MQLVICVMSWNTLIVALDCPFLFLLRCSIFIFILYSNVVFSRECAKCIVVMQPTLFLYLCLTFVKSNSGISLAWKDQSHSQNIKFRLTCTFWLNLDDCLDHTKPTEVLSCYVYKHACSNWCLCQYLFICSHYETLCFHCRLMWRLYVMLPDIISDGLFCLFVSFCFVFLIAHTVHVSVFLSSAVM